MMHDSDWEHGYESALTGGADPAIRWQWPDYPTPGEAHRHWQRTRGYEEGKRLLNSTAFREGFAAGLRGESSPPDAYWSSDTTEQDMEDWRQGSGRARMGARWPRATGQNPNG